MHNKAIIALVGAVGALNVKPAVSKDQYLSQVDAEVDAEFLEDWFWGFSQIPNDQYLSQVDAETIQEEDQDLGEMKHILEKKEKEWKEYVSSFEANIEAEREEKEAQIKRK